MGLIGLIWSSEGSIIGSGWLFGALFAAQAAGTAALISWLIAGVAVIILALVHSELGGMYPVAGGTARFPHYAFGSVAGASFGWFSWLQAVTVAPIEVLAVEGYTSYWWHGLIHSTGPKAGLITPLGYLMAVVLMAVFVAVNFLGIRWLSFTNSGLTWWKIAIPVFAIIILFTKFHGSNFGAGGGFMPYGVKGILSAIASAGVMFALLGFEQADQLAGEAKNPQKNIPRAIIGAVFIGVVIYVLLQVVFIGAIPHSLISGPKGWLGIPTGNPILNGPFAGLAGLVALGWLAFILRLDAIVSPGGTGLIYTTSTSRVSYGLGRNRYFPSLFQKTDKRGVPWVGLIFAFAMGLLFFLPFPSWHKLVGFITSASVLMYAGAPLALGAFRKQVPDAHRPYRVPGAVVMAPVAFVVANLIIYFSGWDIIWRLGVAIVIGYVIIALSMADNPNAPSLEWRSALWLPVYLVGLGLISWQGDYCSAGPSSTVSCGATNNLPLWYDMVIIAAFSLAIYYWAMVTRLPDEKMLEYVGKVDPQE
jgi:amino acid transporter